MFFMVFLHYVEANFEFLLLCYFFAWVFVCAIFYPFSNYEKCVLIIFIYMYHKYFQTDLSSVISQVGTITKWDPSSNNQHFLSPSFSFSSPVWSTWPTWKRFTNLTNLKKWKLDQPNWPHLRINIPFHLALLFLSGWKTFPNISPETDIDKGGGAQTKHLLTI